MKFTIKASAPLLGGLAICALAAILSAGGAAAQGAAGLSVQLNKVAKAGGACRMTFVADNRLGTALDALALDVVVFDDKGVVGPRLVLDMGALGDGTTRVIDFDVPDTDCGKVSRLLLNGVPTCTAGGQPIADCAASVTPESKIGTLPFDK